MECYLDNSATTRPEKAVVEEIVNILRSDWGNPSSLYRKGVEAELVIRAAREKVAKSLSVAASTIYFSYNGTSSINTAIRGATETHKYKYKKIITTAVEHAASIKTFEYLENKGYKAVYVKPRLDGEGLAEQIFESVDENTALVSVMHVNNEMGQIFDVKKIADYVKKKNPETIFHCDAVQSYMKLPISLRNSNIDLLSISAHKFHGPKGIGALYIKENTRISPVIFGGGQERNIFPGTENSAYISGFGKAVEIASPIIKENNEYISGLNVYLRKELEKIPAVFVLTPENNSLPYILSLGINNIRSEILLHFLEAREIYVSSGSACSKGKKSSVLTAFGISDKQADCVIRISMAKNTKLEEIDKLCEALQEAVVKIRSSR